MSTSKKIFKSLIDNSKRDSVANFLRDLFIEENQGLPQWNDKYDELIDKYYREYAYEDRRDKV